MANYNPFTTVTVDNPNTNQFDLSFDNKLTLDMGKLYPVLVQETLPGDYMNITPEMLIRFAPLTFPIMHRIDATIHFFYVPNRICWNNWTKFLAGEDYMPPFFQGTTEDPWEITAGNLFDYLGLPLTANMKEQINALPWLALSRIYNEYYMDQNNDANYLTARAKLEELATFNGLITPADINALMTSYEQLEIPVRAWEHDYFTSALPFAQKGDAVNIPIELANMPVNITGVEITPGGAPYTGPIQGDGGTIDSAGGSGGSDLVLTGETDSTGAELTGTINQLRIAMQLQKFLEKNARSGTRYNELIRAHFGEDIGDARINRPEYIGGIKNNIVISEVFQTSQTTEDGTLGDYAGHATGVVSGNNISFRCPEHGFIIGLLSVIPKTAYFQGINRKMSRMSYLDYYWAEFAHIGEQAILNKEVYYDTAATAPDPLPNETFGYIPRYSEYKYNPSEVHGDFRTTMLDFHLARDFDNIPVLNDEFIYCDPGKRIFAVQDETNSLYAHVYFDIMAKRKIPFYTNPGGL